MINDSVNQTLSRTLLTAFSVFLVVIVLYIWGGEGVHLFAFVMVVGVIVGTYSSIYIASPLLMIFGEGREGVGKPRSQAGAGAGKRLLLSEGGKYKGRGGRKTAPPFVCFTISDRQRNKFPRCLSACGLA